MSKHALPRGTLTRRLARVGLAAVFATVELFAAFAVGPPWLGTALILMAGWNIGLGIVALVTIRDDTPRWGAGASGVPQ